MPEQLTLTHESVNQAAKEAADRIKAHFTANPVPPWASHDPFNVYPVPRGGVPATYLLAGFLPLHIVDNVESADFIFDDLIDSGRTCARYFDSHPFKPFFALYDKRNSDPGWIVFPWDHTERSIDDTIVGTLINRLREKKQSFNANDNVADIFANQEERDLLQLETVTRAKSLLDALLIDTTNDHNTQGTADRMARMYTCETFRGRLTRAPKLTTFPNKGFDELLTSGPITVRSMCSHHMCPILGTCYIGMIPGERVIGLSKFNRVVDWFAARGQIQEELVVQIADYLEAALKPKGLGVVIRATHTCMTWRGVREHSSASMTTSVMRGSFRDKPEARAEFLHFVPNA